MYDNILTIDSGAESNGVGKEEEENKSIAFAYPRGTRNLESGIPLGPRDLKCPPTSRK